MPAFDPNVTPYANEWALKIIEIYMTWHTFFIIANVLVLGWVFGRTIEEGVRHLLEPVCWLLILLNCLTAASTVVVACTVQGDAPETYRTLIVWAGIVNSMGSIAAALVWFVCWKRLHRGPHAAV
jgi:hypothetical protein